MKPTTILIPLLAMLCGCEPKEKYIDSAEFKQFTIDALTKQNDWNGAVLKFRLAELENRLKRLESTALVREVPEIDGVWLIYTTNINAIHLDPK